MNNRYRGDPPEGAPFPWEGTEDPAQRIERKPKNPITNLPNWIRDALGLTEAAVPRELAQPHVIPAIDAFQDGWALAEYRFLNGQILTLPTPTITLTGREDLIRRPTC